MLIDANTLFDPKFWVGYWAHAVGIYSNNFSYEENFKLFGVEENAFSQWWADFSGYYEGIFDESDGDHEDPATIVLTFPHDIKISIEFHAAYTYYMLDAPELSESVCLGCLGPHQLLPIFRWEEIVKLASSASLNPAVERIERDLILLILCPCAGLTDQDDLKSACQQVQESWEATRLTDSTGAEKLSIQWGEAVNCGDYALWLYDNEAGWVTDARYHNFRNPKNKEPSAIKKINEIILKATS